MVRLPNANYKFTDKKIPPLSVMSAVLSMVSLIALIILFFFSFNVGGEVPEKVGTTSLLCAVFSLTAIGFSIRTYFQKNVFHILAHVGLGIGMLNLFYLMYVYGLGIMA